MTASRRRRRRAAPPFPREIGNDKYLVWGQTGGGRYLQVIFVYRSEDEVDFDALSAADLLAMSEGTAVFIYVIHAMELTPRMKKQFRRKRKP